MRKLLLLLLLVTVMSAPLFSAVGFGGWDDLAFYASSQTNRNYLVNTVRVWFSAAFTEKLSLYLRGKHQYVKNVNAAAGASTSETTQSVIDLDLGYLRLKDGGLTLTLGRGYFRLGIGLVYNGIADGVSGELDLGKVQLSAFANYTGLLEADSNPYNFSMVDINEGAKRFFSALSVRLLPAAGLSFQLGGLVQRDFGDENYEYNTFYLTAGVSVNWAVKLQSSLEFVYQGGEGPALTERVDIQAFAAVFSTKWFLFNRKESGFTLDVAWAGGGSNRFSIYPGYMSDNKKDTQFYSFGVYSTGFAFEPDLSNLLYASLGFQLFPFTGGLFADSLLRFNFSWYRRADKAGPISEDTDNPEADLGMALDMQYTWRIVSDVSFTLGAGAFKPGKAFADRDLRFLGQAGCSISF